MGRINAAQRTGAAFGARRGLGYLIRILAGMVTVRAIVASGLTGLMLALPGARPVAVALASAYIVDLAWRIATASPLGERSPAHLPFGFSQNGIYGKLFVPAL